MDTVTTKENGLGNNSSTRSFQCVDAIEICLFIEKEGLSFYEKAVKNSLEPTVKTMFLRLAEEEREHLQILQTKLQFLKPAISGKGRRQQKIRSFIGEELEGKIFSVSNFFADRWNTLRLEFSVSSNDTLLSEYNNICNEINRIANITGV